jgi:hypothetical protein
VIRQGLAAYVEEVANRTFPQAEHWFGMPDADYDTLVASLAEDDALEAEWADETDGNDDSTEADGDEA